MLTHIDLFSGIGGFALAAQWVGFRTVAFCEIDPYAQEILKQSFGALSVSNAERRDGRTYYKREGAPKRNGFAPCIYGDIRAFPSSLYRGATLLTGGFPCQPFSQAGKQRGKEDDRYLWPEMLRVISEARPAWVLGENVAGIVPMALDEVLSDLEGEGYACQSLIIPACAVDARHRRDRVWIVAYRGSEPPLSMGPSGQEAVQPDRNGGEESMADAKNTDWRRANGETNTGRRNQEVRRCGKQDGKPQHWPPEPDLGRVAHGVPFRVDRLKALGNAIVPQVAYEIIKGIRDLHNAPDESASSSTPSEGLERRSWSDG